MMKKVLLTLLCAGFATAVMAGETPQKPSFSGFTSNGFWDNWELSVGAGVGTALSNGKNFGLFGDRINFEGNISATKWIHPVVGVRLQFQGGRFNNFDQMQGLEKWPYLFVHPDLMINASNWIGGYREDRAYYAVPFFGFGYMASNFSERAQRDNAGSTTGQAFAFTYGILNKFRLSPAFDFNIELKGLMAPSHLAPAKMSGAYLFGFSATAGFTYRFNKRGWTRGAVGYSADDIRAFQAAVAKGNDALAAAKAENERLNEQLKAAQAAQAAKAAAEKAAADKCSVSVVGEQSEEPALVLYDFNQSKLAPKECLRLDLLAKKIKEGPKDRVYRISGHADSQTGTSAVNQRISDRRAKAVYDYLIGKGVKADQLVYEGKGDKANMFPNPKTNRAVIVE